MQPEQSTSRNFIFYAAFLTLFALGAVLVASNKDVTRGFDELAHASYIADLQATGDAWPRLDRLRMLDPTDFQLTADPNYLNHPPLFYLSLAHLGPRLENNPPAIRWHRMANAFIATVALAAAMALGFANRQRTTEFLAFSAPILLAPVLIPLAGAINNDNLAFAGGAVTVTAAYLLLQNGRAIWFAAMLAGFVVASAAKLTGLLLTGGFVAALLAYLIWKKRLRAAWIVAAALVFALALAPYIVFVLQYGSPAPDTASQMDLIRTGAQQMGWADQPRLSFPAYALHFVGSFVANWLPTLQPRHAFHYAMFVLPLATVASAVAGAAIAAHRLVRSEENPLDTIIVAGFAALAATFVAHLWISYGRHVETGWMMDAYPRYYLPLIAILPLAAIVLLRAIERPQLRVWVAVFLIASPLAFRVLGSPTLVQF